MEAIRSGASGPRGEEPLQVAPLDQLHDRVRQPRVAPVGVDPHHALGPVDPRHELGLAREAGLVQLGQAAREEDLQGHVDPAAEVAGAEHGAHAALADELLDAVAAVDHVAGLQRQRRLGHRRPRYPG
jgi:hypothetical protein